MKQDDVFSDRPLRASRLSHGLHTRYLSEILGRRAARDIERGIPLIWDLAEKV